MNYDGLFEKMPRYKNFLNNKPLRKLYGILSQPENVKKMIEANDIAKKPAICGMVRFIEKFCGRHSEEGLLLEDKEGLYLRRFIGAMITDIMAANGYRPAGRQKIIGKGQSDHFLSGACYIKTGGRSSAGSNRVRRQTSPRYTPGGDLFEAGVNPPEKGELDFMIAQAFDTAARSFHNLYDGMPFYTDNKFGFLPAEGIMYPFSRIIYRFSRAMYMSAYQIAAEIEINHPGVVEMSGMLFMPCDDADELSGEAAARTPQSIISSRLGHKSPARRNLLSFVELVELRLIELCATDALQRRRPGGDTPEGGDYQMAFLSGLYGLEGMLHRNCEFEFFTSRGPTPFFRQLINPADEEKLFERLAAAAGDLDTRYSSRFYERYGLEEMIVQAIAGDNGHPSIETARYSGDGKTMFLTLNQLKKKMFDMAADAPGEFRRRFPYNFDGYPVYALYLELLKRRGRFVPGFISTLHLGELSLSDYYETQTDEGGPDDEGTAPLSELGNYVPIIALRK